MSEYNSFGMNVRVDEIVISGMSGSFPESRSVSEFQENLLHHNDMVTEDDRHFNVDDPEVPKRGGKLHDIQKFDAGFFGVHYKQAEVMDPQIAIFLEKALEAIMDAGLNPTDLEGSSTGVFIANGGSETEVNESREFLKSQYPVLTGTTRSMIPHRLSYYLKLKGPSYSIDTHCSSSLHAVEHAFRSLRGGLCDRAIVGGASLVLRPFATVHFNRLGVLSLDGRCKTFDEKADGYVRSEAVCAILLEKSADAKRVYSKLVYAKTNFDGFKEEGIMHPSSESQGLLLNEFYKECGVHPNDLTYIEAHGTGTKIGDPVELESIDNAIAKCRSTPLLVGSLKSNMGHAETAAGLCSIVKTLLIMDNGLLYANLNFDKCRENEGLQTKRLKIVTENIPISDNNALIGISSFGFGGTNSHLLLQRNPKQKKSQNSRTSMIVCVSGRLENSVAVILDDIKSRPIDTEYISLYHNIFRLDIKGHDYKGFTILTEEGCEIDRSIIRSCTKYKNNIYMVVTRFEDNWASVASSLQNIEMFSNFVETVETLLAVGKGDIFNSTDLNSNSKEKQMLGSCILQLGIVYIFRELEIAFDSYQDYNGSTNCIIDYAMKHKTLEETISKISSGMIPNETASNLQYSCKENVTIVEIGHGFIQNSTSENEHLKFNPEEDGLSALLKILGRLYQSGVCFDLNRFYPKNTYPVSRGTPMISPLVKWNHEKDWFVATFKGTSLSTHNSRIDTYTVSLEDPEWEFISGHVIDGRVLFPATAFLYLAWKSLAATLHKNINKLSVSFTNCKFMKALTLPKLGQIRLLVRILKGGTFEILENDNLLVTGFINQGEGIAHVAKDQSALEDMLTSEDIYKELLLRGYEYKGMFKGLKHANLRGSRGQLIWENNWVTFMDNILQMKILGSDSRELFVPTYLGRLSIDPVVHLNLVKNSDTSLLEVRNLVNINTLKSGGIVATGMTVTSIPRRKLSNMPILEKYVFVPNEQIKLDLEESLRINLQIIIENFPKASKLSIIEMWEENDFDVLSNEIFERFKEIPKVYCDITVLSSTPLEIKGATVSNDGSMPGIDATLIIGSHLLHNHKKLQHICKMLTMDGFILSQENIDCVIREDVPFTITTVHTTANRQLVLFRRKNTDFRSAKIVHITSKDLSWLKDLQLSVQSFSNVIAVAQDDSLNGILGLVNCIRQEPELHKVRCVFTFHGALAFDVDAEFYQEQLSKNLAINVFKNGSWGTYRHLLLESVTKVENEHSFVDVTSIGDLSSLEWIEGHLKPDIITTDILVHVYYAALNFKDLMFATGRIPVQKINRDETCGKHPQGFEFVGKLTSGQRVMGINDKGTIGTLLVNPLVLLPVPNEWSLEEAATVVAVYGTVLYAMSRVGIPRRHESILIHSGAGGIGQAAINLAIFLGCEVFTTVGTKEKKEFLKTKFPSITDDKIGNSRDTSFEQMIAQQTKGKGVDFVLNSLSNEKLQATVRCLARGGKFVELGKYDSFQNESLRLNLMAKEASFYGVHLDEVISKYSGEGSVPWNMLMEYIAKGAVKPLNRTVFDFDKVEEAYRFMATGKHIGKILVKIREEDKREIIPSRKIILCTPRYYCHKDLVYVIVGGLGGFGLELVDWLLLRGARKIVISSKRGVRSGYQHYRMKIWHSYFGTQIQIYTEDITKENGCRQLIQIASEFGQIHAIFNLAADLKDALLENQSTEKFEQTFRPKVETTRNLDKISRELCPNLRNFVVFSSLACGRGNAGQANYGMGNSIIERICEKRQLEGFPATAIQWGAIAEVGLAAQLFGYDSDTIIAGTIPQKISNCLVLLDRLLTNANSVISSMIVADKNKDHSTSGDLTTAIGRILGIRNLKTISMHSTLPELGMDSLSATEVRQILENNYEISVNQTEIRTLTFFKLQEMNSRSTQGEFARKIQHMQNIESGQIDVEHESTDNIVTELKSRNPKGPLTIFFPGIDGEANGMKPLAANLDATVVGLQYNSILCEFKTVDDMMLAIIPIVKLLLEDITNFNIVAHSFGSLLAIETVRILEQSGLKGNLFIVDGSPELCKTVIDTYFESEMTIENNEINLTVLPHDIFDGNNLMANLSDSEILNNCKSVEGKKNIMNGILKSYDSRIKACLLYNQKLFVKIKTPVRLYKASIPMSSYCGEDYGLSELCENIIKIHTIEGNHWDILQNGELAHQINDVLLDV